MFGLGLNGTASGDFTSKIQQQFDLVDGALPDASKSRSLENAKPASYLQGGKYQ